MTAPRWTVALLRRLAPPDRVDDVLGDHEESHRTRVGLRGRVMGTLLTGLETLDMSFTLLRGRRRDPNGRTRRTWFSWLDFKLGFRMLVKYPGLSVVGVCAMAVGIAIGTGYFELVHDMTDASLPGDDGQRVVSLWNWNRATRETQDQSLREFAAWRDELRAIEDIGAVTAGPGTLIADDGRVESVAGASVTASAFRMMGVAPILGRPLVAADEQIGAPPVTAIGYDLWNRLGADPGIVGQRVRLGGRTATIVGVMPAGFAFPVRNNLWVPLEVSPAAPGYDVARPMLVFGRLATGVTREDAEAELALLNKRTGMDAPDSNRHAIATVHPYAASFFIREAGNVSTVELLAVQSMLLVVLVVACFNVATLVFARTAARESELAVRTALGASRARIVSQLFIEALVLTLVAAVVGLTLADRATRWGLDILKTGEESMPFWWKEALSAPTLAFAGVLVLLAAIVTGVFPALRATGQSLRTRLQDLTARGTGVRFGVWSTVLIVSQVAVSVGLLTYVLQNGWSFARPLTTSITFAGDAYLSAHMQLERPIPTAELSEAEHLRFARITADIASRLATEPGVTGVSLATAVPGGDYPRERFEVDAGTGMAGAGDRASVRTGRVAPGFFELLEMPILAGRAFSSVDAEAQRAVVIVNERFVRDHLGGQNAVGRSVRLYGEDDKAGPWHEVVGVVGNLWMSNEAPDAAGLYLPLTPRVTHPLLVVVRAPDDARVLGPRLSRIVASVDPSVRLNRVLRVDEIIGIARRASMFFVFAIALVTGMVLMLATAGTYSLMSFIVSRRTREIGIRKALGASTRGVLGAVFSRALMQLGIGVALGMLPIIIWWDDTTPVLLAALPLVLFLSGAVACAVPVARALRIEPTEALRET